jgi:hypothetical protein
MTTQTAFCDLPHDERFALLAAIDAAGGLVAGYTGLDVQIALPSPTGPFFAAMRRAAMTLQPGSLHHFPLGSDHAPAHQRHDANYPGSKGFWLYARNRSLTHPRPRTPSRPLTGDP